MPPAISSSVASPIRNGFFADQVISLSIMVAQCLCASGFAGAAGEAAPAGSIFVTTHSPGLRSTNSKRIGAPGLALFAIASFAATNSIVIFGQLSVATGSCVMVSAPVFASTSSTRPTALCATTLAPPALVSDAAVKLPSAAFRLLSASIRKLARVTTWSPSLTP